MSHAVCRSCGTPIPFDEPIPRDGECASCGQDLRCCTNCRHYDTHFNNSCRETMADSVEDKTRRNFCEYFEFNPEPFRAAKPDTRVHDARAKLDALFGGKPSSPSSGDARSKLD